ncbi:MAG: hypothetical protein ACFB15_21575 [Cyclobacteriaceae bacterium]
MKAKDPNYNLVIEELEQVPVEYLPSLLKMMQAFREVVTLAPAEDTFRQGWEEATSGETIPITELWNEDNV